MPAHVSLVDLGGEWAVDWTWGDGRSPSSEGMLLAFAGIASAELAMGFVQRFGTLSLCRDHLRPLDTAEHKSCERLKPEPVALWVEHARRVREVLHVLDALDRGLDPDPHEVRKHDPLKDPAGPKFVRRWNLKLQRRARREDWPTDLLSELLAEVADYEPEYQEIHDEERALKDKIRKQMSEAPDSEDEWRRRVRVQILTGLQRFPATLTLSSDERPQIRLALQTGVGVLSRVYLQLAFQAAGTAGVAFCGHCGRPYSPKRRPKRDQSNFCPSCRKLGAPQKEHARRRRRSDA